MARSRGLRGLTYRQVALTLVVTLCVGGGVTAIQARITLGSERDAAAARMAGLADAAEANAAAAAFRLDTELALYVTRGLAASRAIASAAIRDEQGKLLATTANAEPKPAPDWLLALAYSDLGVLEVPLYDQGRPDLQVGTLGIHPDRHALAADFLGSLRTSVLLDAAKAILLALVLSVIFYRALTRPLLRLDAAIREVVPGEDQQLSGLDDLRARQDEFARLLGSFEDQLAMFRSVLRERGVLLDALRLRNAALGAMDSGLLIIDSRHPELPIVDANTAVSSMMGVPEATLVGRNFLDFVERDKRSADDLQRIEAFINAGLTGNAASGVFEIFSADGHTLWCKISIVPVSDDSGAITHRVVILNDITAARDTEEQLRHSQKMDALGKVAGGVAHDFNNILAIMKGQLELAGLDLANEPRLLDRIEPLAHSVDRAADLTRKLLRFSRKMPLQEQVICVDDVIEHTSELLGSTLTPEIEVHLDLAAPEQLVQLDSGEFEDALLNLAVNARDAMPRGGRLTLATWTREIGPGDAALRDGMAPGNYLELTVSDTGTGMDEETRERLFEPFFTTKDQSQGTGLGLAQVYAFVERSGGNIQVRSAPGAGSHFTIILPLHCGPRPAADGDRATPAMTGGDETILVVDDEPALLGVAREFLEHLGYTVLTASDPAQALELFRARPGDVDLLLSDVLMPGGMNGHGLAAALLAERPELKVLMASGYDAMRADDTSDRPQLTKPYALGTLAAAVRSVLDGQTLPRQPD